MAVAANIRLQRKKAGLTQIDLADKLGVSIATLRRWEAGETSPTGTRIVELAKLLHISPDEIVNDDKKAGKDEAKVFSANHDDNSKMLVFEGEGTRIELPPTEKGYELFNKLVDNLIERKKHQQA